MKIKVNNANQAKWSEVIVKSTMPPGLEKLDEIAHNIWWSWNYEAINLFREVDSEFETSYSGNPIVMLENTLYSHLEELVANQGFMNRLNEVYTEFRKYMEEPANTELPSVAYFSMEYGLTDI
ncbi:MAG: DUF3417 domain-containing protein, partial [Bacteroidales bacterium]|nr:DUF3417 domain-containing protein [Bacteroidales bacterium]